MVTESTNIQPEPAVLIADSSAIIQRSAQAILEQEHIRVLIAGDALSVLTLVADEKPAVIFLATHLPRMNGFRVCRILRQNLLLRQIPIIMFTEKDGRFDKLRGQMAGVTDYLRKPLDSAELVEAAKKYLRIGPEVMPQKP